MLQSFYNNFGFFGALAISISLFVFFIFWIAGIAGIALPYDGGKKKGSDLQIIFAVLIPVYPVIWLLTDMYRQHKMMTEED